MKLKKACVLISCIFMFISSITGYAFSVDTFSLDDSIVVGTGGNKLTVSAELGGEALPPAGDLMIIILNKDVQFTSLTTDEQILANAKYVDFINNLQNRTEVSYSFTPSGWEDGTYAVRITFSYALTRTFHEYYTLKIVNPQTIIDAVTDLSTVGFSEAGAKLDLYIDQNEYINMGAVPEYYTASANIGKSFVYARELRKNGVITGNQDLFTDPDDVVDTMKAAVVLDAAMYGDAVRLKTLAEKYGEFFANLVPADTSYESVSALISGLDSYSADIVQFWEEIKQCAVFAHMYNGTYQNVINVIENYGSILGVDMSYLAQNNVDFSEIAPKIDRSNVLQYLNCFPGAVKSAADAVIAGRKSPKPTIVTGNDGNKSSLGGGGIIKYDSTLLPQKDNTDDKENLDDADSDAQQTGDVFSDLNGYEWAQEAIMTLYVKEIIHGNGNGEFLPEMQVTRAEFLKMLVCALDITQDGGYTAPEFDDCRTTDWWYPYVNAAYSKGIANGLGSNFGAQMTITREDAVTFLGRAAEAKGKIIETVKESTFNEEISGYALNYVIAMNEFQIVTGDENGKFNPKNTTTRAEAAVLIDRFVRWMEE